MRSFWIVSICLGAASAAIADTPPKGFTPEALSFYDREVQPLLKAHCYKCHGDAKVKGNFSLTTRAAVLKGGDLGSAVSLDKPDESHLLKAINYKGDLEMPPTGKLKPEQIETLTKWVKAGLPMKDTVAATAKVEHKGGAITPEARNYWAYRPVKSPPIPSVNNVD